MSSSRHPFRRLFPSWAWLAALVFAACLAVGLHPAAAANGASWSPTPPQALSHPAADSHAAAHASTSAEGPTTARHAGDHGVHAGTRTSHASCACPSACVVPAWPTPLAVTEGRAPLRAVVPDGGLGRVAPPELRPPDA